MHKRQDLGLANPLLYKIGRSSLRRRRVLRRPQLRQRRRPRHRRQSAIRSAAAAPRTDSTRRRAGAASTSTAFAAVALQNQPPRESISLPGHQRPVRSHKIVVTVSCALACRMAAFALVAIGKAKPFEVDSQRVHAVLSAAARRSRSISARGSSALRSGLSHNRRIEAEVAGVILDAHNHVQGADAREVHSRSDASVGLIDGLIAVSSRSRRWVLRLKLIGSAAVAVVAAVVLVGVRGRRRRRPGRAWYLILALVILARAALQGASDTGGSRTLDASSFSGACRADAG